MTQGPPRAAETPAGKPAGPAAKAPPPEARATALPEPPPWYLTLREEPPAWLRLALGLTCILVILAVWYLFTAGDRPEERAISPSKLPSPGEVFFSFDDLIERHLGDSIIATLMRVLIGFFWATLVGVGWDLAGELVAFAGHVRGLCGTGRRCAAGTGSPSRRRTPGRR